VDKLAHLQMVFYVWWPHINLMFSEEGNLNGYVCCNFKQSEIGM